MTTDTETSSSEGSTKVKVYELAKELGTDSFGLLDKIKALGIGVKSHMSELEDADVQRVRDHLNPPAPVKTPKATKTATRTAKSATAKTTATKTSPTKATTAKTATTVKRKAAAAATTATATATAAPAATVIRRRTKSTGEVETVTTTDGISHKETIPAPGSPEALAAEAAAQAAAAAESGEQSAMETYNAEGEPTEAPLQGSGLNMPSFLSARKGGLTARNSGSILTIIKEEPKKAPVITPRIQPKPSTPGSVGGGIINLGKEAIDKMAEEELSFKKKGGRNTPREVTEVKISDYRAKKELVFLPKKKRPMVNREVKQTQITTPSAHKRVIRIEAAITVAELCQRMGIKTGELIKKLISSGVMATMNYTLDVDTATLLATDYGFEIENVEFKEEAVIPTTADKAEDLKPRPPIVTVMGHVDHGKTSLLDAIRKAKVAAGEAGGITQHIGAYTVELEGKQITFIDTPGHEAFTMMRSRGANATDIVILVVAADDGVMPQTREAIDHAKAAGVPIIIAVNKIDKPSANADRVLKDLAELDILAEEWGGQYQFMRVSALKGTGLKELLEAILLQAEVLELKANPDRPAEGVILEARLDKNRGPVASILVKNGSMKTGDVVVAGSFAGKVRALISDKGAQLRQIGPSHAAELLGLEGVPLAGEAFNVMPNEVEAKKLVTHRIDKAKAALAAKSTKMTLDDLFSNVKAGEVKELSLILKTDVFGSAEAIKENLLKLTTEKVKIKVLSATTGGVTESDVMLATASNAVILAFNVRPETKAMALAAVENIEIKSYSIIYELLDDMKKAMAGLLDKKAVEKYLGRAEVRETFTVPKLGLIAGCSVVDGKIVRNSQVRLLRDSRIIYTGKIGSLKRFKDDAKEVATGYECGIGIENYNDVKQGDVIESFIVDLISQDVSDLGTAASTAPKKDDKKTEQKEASR